MEVNYSLSRSYVNEVPDTELIEYAALIPEGPILDIGVGNGRNAFFLAQMGFHVLGVDISEEVVNECNRRAQELKLPVRAIYSNIMDFKIDENTYACIICSYVLPFLKRSDALRLIERIKHGLLPQGIALIKTFTTRDPGYIRLKKKGLSEVEKNTFYSPKLRSYFFYVEPGELKELFTDFKLISYAEGYSLDITHDEPHYHGWASVLAQKPGK